MIRSVTTREPTWTEQDRAEALALAVHRASLCPGGCGQPLGEATSHHESGPEYDATHTTCRACAALLEAQRVVGDGKANPDAPARLWQVIKTKRKG